MSKKVKKMEFGEVRWGTTETSKKDNIVLVVVTNFEAYHFWKKAPKEVKFLRNPHRHIFGVRLFIEVSEKDRELEFFMVQRVLKKFCDRNYKGKTFSKSCEMIASEIKKYINRKYKKCCSVAVYEDKENGAIVS